MSDHLTAVLAMLGPAENRYADPGAWDRLHSELGIRLPADYRVLVDAYAPIELNDNLYLPHPATGRWNLGEWIQETVRSCSEIPWEQLHLEADEDPRPLVAPRALGFGTADGLWPLARADDDTLFLDAGSTTPRLLVEDENRIWTEYRMGFAEWLRRYLNGEEMTGPWSATPDPGPVKLRRLPMSRTERPEPWWGPDRGR
ncbi:SMI1/KNR4 family protein [Streptomyces sp. NPDC002809]|uniref:SMI1/KNR4 family protein n=1 Tax=Streptomyces sp. NPDC002809 TaxID=3154433 RepID=UPI00332856C2